MKRINFLPTLVLFAVFLFIERIKSKSITFSYRTCLSETNLVDIEHRQNQHRQYFTLTVENFHFRLIHRYDSLKNSFDFGPSNRTSRKKFSNFDDQYQSAIDFYQTIDRWNYVNLTFDDRTSRVLLSLNNDEHYSIPLMDYPWSYRNETNESILDVEIEYEAFDRNVTCLVPHLGFSRNFLPQSTQCMINTKLCGLPSDFASFFFKFHLLAINRIFCFDFCFRTTNLHVEIENCRTVLSIISDLRLLSIYR